MISDQFEVNLEDISRALRSVHKCNAAIVYGSLASGHATPTSDYDVAGFAKVATRHRIAGQWRNSYLDVFLHPESELSQSSPDLLYLRGGRVLFDDENHSAARLLRQLDEVFERGPAKLPTDEINARRRWAWKMLDRARVEDVEGNFRRAWLLTALLEDYFVSSGQWYFGPKKSLTYLQGHKPAIYVAFESALKASASIGDMERLVQTVCGDREPEAAELALRTATGGP